MNETREVKQELPSELARYRTLWGQTYGREWTPDELKQLNACARALAERDPEFKAVLGRMMFKDFVENENDLGNPRNATMILIEAMSTYATKFGVLID